MFHVNWYSTALKNVLICLYNLLTSDGSKTSRPCLLVSKERSRLSIQMEGAKNSSEIRYFIKLTVSGIPIFSFQYQEFHSFCRIFGSLIYSFALGNVEVFAS